MNTDYFKSFGAPTALFALATAFLLYRNGSGIAVTLESAAAVLFAVSVIKRAGLPLARGSKPLLAAILLLGISCFLTANRVLQVLSAAGVFLLLLFVLVLNFRQPAGDDFGENVTELVMAPLRGIAGLGSSFKDASAYVQQEKAGWKKLIFPVLIGLAVSLPLVIVILLLLCSADVVFQDLFAGIFDLISWSPFLILFSAFLWFIGVYSTIRALRETKEESKRHREGGNAVVGITVCLPVTLIYLVFSVIQIAFLFLRNMDLPDGYSYADYVHEGFYQLLAACILNLLLVLFFKEFFRKNRFLDVLLSIIGGCTYIMTASSALRMVMYIRAYGLTFLRVVVLWALAVIAVLFAGVLIRVWNEKFYLFRHMLVTVILFWLLLAFSRPERLIAEYDLYHSEAETDLHYLSSLSSDAAPVLYKYARENGIDTETKWDGEEYHWFYRYEQKLSEEKDWRQLNLPDIVARGYRNQGSSSYDKQQTIGRGEYVSTGKRQEETCG